MKKLFQCCRRLPNIILMYGGLFCIFSSVAWADAGQEKMGSTEPFAEEKMRELFDYLESENLGNVVVSATKKAQRLEQAPSVVDVVTATEIRNRGYQSVGEALRNIPGLALVDDHLNLNVGVRGVFADTTAPSEIFKLMINGQAVAFRPASANVLGPELIPIEAVKRIEVLRGPTSALYGANAFLGVINVVTKTGEDAREEGALEGYLAPRTYYMQNVMKQTMNGGGSWSFLGKSDGFNYLIAGTYDRSDRSGLMLPGLDDIIHELLYREHPESFEPSKGHPTPGYVADRRTDYRIEPISKKDIASVGSIYGQVGYKNPLGNLRLDGNFQYFDKFGEFQDYSLLTHKNRIAYSNSFLRLTYENKVSDLSVTSSLSYAWGAPLGIEAIYSNDDSQKLIQRKLGYTAIDSVLELTWSVSDDSLITIGADFIQDKEDLVQLVYTDDTTQIQVEGPDFGEKDFDNLGFYGQGIFSLLDGLDFTVGARIDRNSEVACNAKLPSCFGTREDLFVEAIDAGESDTLITDRGDFQLSYRGAIVYSIPFWSSYLKLITGTSFKPPSPYQLYHKPLSKTGSSTGNPNLKPQTATSYELVVGTKPNARTHLTFNVFWSEITDIVVLFREQGSIRGRNADVHTMGVEGKITYQFSRTLSSFANCSLLVDGKVSPKKKDGETDASWSFSSLNKTIPVGMYPSALANLGLQVFIPDQYVNIFLAVNYVGQRNASLTNNQLFSNPISETYTLDPYLFLNFTISSVGLELLGDEQTRFAASWKGPPGSYIDAGQGGIDIPGLGTRFYLIAEQSF